MEHVGGDKGRKYWESRRNSRKAEKEAKGKDDQKWRRKRQSRKNRKWKGAAERKYNNESRDKMEQ